MYSQVGEDDEILKLWGDRPPGSVLEIGAWHPITFSNSRAMIKRGWSAVLVEPSPGPFLLLMRACTSCDSIEDAGYGERKRTTCSRCGAALYCASDKIKLLSASVGTTSSIISMHVTDDALTTSESGNYAIWYSAGGFYGNIFVPQTNLREIWTTFGTGFDVVSIDTEGTSVDLAAEYLRIAWPKPRIVCVEHDSRIDELLAASSPYGFHEAARNSTNLILVRES